MLIHNFKTAAERRAAALQREEREGEEREEREEREGRRKSGLRCCQILKR